MRVEVSFPSPTRIKASSKDLTVEVGPPPDRGGDPGAYGPFDLLLCSLATCTGFQVADFLQQRGFATAGAGVHIEAERSEETEKREKEAPEDFYFYFNQGFSCLSRRDLDGARENWLQALSKRPGDRRVQANLARLEKMISTVKGS